MRLYFDANASTPLDPRVLDQYLVALRNGWANPSSVHQEGQRARALLNEAREICARRLSVRPRQILFFSSATEALNTLIFSLSKQRKGRHLLTDIEHSAVFEPYLSLQKTGCDVSFLSVGKKGALSSDQLLNESKEPLASVATFLAHNETRCITDAKGLHDITSRQSIPLLLDGVAALGKMDLPTLLGPYAMVFGSHKVYAPKGVGMAVLSPDLRIEPLLVGGKQESGRRAGTENVPAIWAFAQALQLLFDEQKESIERQRSLRDSFEQELISSLPGIHRNGEGERVCNVSNLFIEGVEAEELLMLLDQAGIAISVGSACSSGALEPSRTLTHMYSRQRALSSLRISFHKFTTSSEVDMLLSRLKQTILQLRR